MDIGTRGGGRYRVLGSAKVVNAYNKLLKKKSLLVVLARAGKISKTEAKARIERIDNALGVLIKKMKGH